MADKRISQLMMQPEDVGFWIPMGTRGTDMRSGFCSSCVMYISCYTEGRVPTDHRWIPIGFLAPKEDGPFDVRLSVDGTSRVGLSVLGGGGWTDRIYT